MHRIMVLSRTLEETVVDLFCQGDTRCYTPHLGMGEEAVSVGAFYGLNPDDVVSPHYRGSTSAWLVRGLPPADLLAIYLGRQPAGPGRHMVGQWGTNLHLNVMSCASSILGAPIELAVGAALAFKLQGGSQVVVNSFGDGTTNRGNFHEGLNFAAVFKVPVVFVCENNQWAMNMPTRVSVPVPRIADRACAYGFPGVTVDGNDVVAVHDAVQEAVQRARQGLGPTLIEALTYRVAHHSERDPDQYRTKAEREQWMEKSPIRRLEKRLLALDVPQASIGQARKSAQEEIAAALHEARQRPLISAEERIARMKSIYEEVYHG
jgi:TPP-dependent pyruvate/acetoin dehydrogenase alpha subunit